MNNTKNYEIILNNTKKQDWDKIERTIKTYYNMYSLDKNNNKIFFFLVNKKDNKIFLLLQEINKKIDNLAYIQEINKNNTCLFVGLNDKDSGKQEKTEAEAVEIIKKYINNIEYIKEIDGVYTYFDGHTEKEKTIYIETNVINNKNISRIKKDLNQETILIKEKTKTYLY